MKKLMITALSLLLVGMMTACAASTPTSSSAPSSSSVPTAAPSQQTPSAPDSSAEPSSSQELASSQETTSESGTTNEAEGSNILVAYFAYSENMGNISDMDVDAIASASLNRATSNTEGNLQVMAQVIEEKIGADVFHILMTEPYDPDYSTMLPVAIDQMQNEKWPALQGKIENLDQYETIYLGVPVWNSVLPPAMQTFFAENDLSGKTIIPFGIHLGSRFGRMLNEMKELAPGATITEGFTINAETANDEVRTSFGQWLDGQM